MLLIGPLIALCVFGLAFAFGDRAEREAAAIMAGALALSIGLGLFVPPRDQFPAAISDALLMAGFILLALRHRQLWLYAELAVSTVLVIAQLVHDELLSPAREFRVLVDGLNLVALSLLLTATLAGTKRAGPRAAIFSPLTRAAGRSKSLFR